MTTATNRDYLTAQDLKELLRVNRASISRWLKNGWLPPPLRLGRTGRSYRWRRDVIEQFLRDEERHGHA
jgi:predicted DNA-binding transcriptional regulator AlpA